MSDDIGKSESLDCEKDLIENTTIVGLKPKNDLTLSKENLNVSNSPKVTAESFYEYSQAKLKDVFFSGVYEDRIYVESVKGYRDRVIVDEEEARLIKSLKSVLRRGKKFQGENFQGIKKENDEKLSIYVFWSNNADAPPFGRYWFLVDNLISSGNVGIQFALRPLREKETNVTGNIKSCPKCGSVLDQTTNSSSSEIDNSELSVNELARDLQGRFIGVFGQPSEWWENAKPHLTISNVIKVFKLMVLLLVALVTGIGAFIQALVPKVNKTIFALSHFLGQSMPFLLACLDTINKVIGGFFLLITMMWKDMVYGRSPGNNIPQGLKQERSQLSLQHNPKSTSFPTIERGENNPYIRKPRYPYLRSEVQRPYRKSPSPN